MASVVMEFKTLRRYPRAAVKWILCQNTDVDYVWHSVGGKLMQRCKSFANTSFLNKALGSSGDESKITRQC
jgi:hypothetical protein